MVSDNYCLEWKLCNTGQLDRIHTDIYKNRSRTNSIPRLSLQHLQISPLVFTVLALPFKHFSLRPLVGKCVGVK